MYSIAGRQVGSHWVTIPSSTPSPIPQTPHLLTPILHQKLAIATLSTVFGGTFAYAKSGPAKATTTPPINASSKDEEKFIQYVMLRTAPHAASSGGSWMDAWKVVHEKTPTNFSTGSSYRAWKRRRRRRRRHIEARIVRSRATQRNATVGARAGAGYVHTQISWCRAGRDGIISILPCMV